MSGERNAGQAGRSFGRRRAAAVVVQRVVVRTVFIAALAAAAPATAHHGSQEDWDRCRAVALLHLNQGAWSETSVPESATIALLEQMGFVMVEGVFGDPTDSMSDLSSRLVFAEKYFLDQRGRIGDAAAAYPTAAERDPILMSCFGFVWVSVRREIDHLMKWRDRSLDAPEREVWPPGFEKISP